MHPDRRLVRLIASSAVGVHRLMWQRCLSVTSASLVFSGSWRLLVYLRMAEMAARVSHTKRQVGGRNAQLGRSL